MCTSYCVYYHSTVKVRTLYYFNFYMCSIKGSSIKHCIFVKFDFHVSVKHLLLSVSMFELKSTYLSPSITSGQNRNHLNFPLKCSTERCGCVVLIWRPVDLSMIHRWVREFLNDENRGLDILVEYLSFAQCAVMWVLLHALALISGVFKGTGLGRRSSCWVDMCPMELEKQKCLCI